MPATYNEIQGCIELFSNIRNPALLEASCYVIISSLECSAHAERKILLNHLVTCVQNLGMMSSDLDLHTKVLTNFEAHTMRLQTLRRQCLLENGCLRATEWLSDFGSRFSFAFSAEEEWSSWLKDMQDAQMLLVDSCKTVVPFASSD